MGPPGQVPPGQPPGQMAPGVPPQDGISEPPPQLAPPVLETIQEEPLEQK